ncbi:MAG TPA: serine/threonine-protein kinase [Pyrinomonadaceae bacterium]|nr:serine/threonine-protein kinase [Pyrinomonadaceae bacterium]
MNALTNSTQVFISPTGFRYFLQERIAGGGGGEVYGAVGQTGQRVALKFINPNPHNRGASLATWINECNSSLRCQNHPHIIRVFEYFQTAQGHLVIVMERADCSLADVIKRGYRFDTKAICLVGMQVLQALSYIHSLTQPIIHRDVTPKNVLVFPNWIYKLSDFGISKNVVTHEEIARTFIGYSSYIPPELLARGYSRQQADLYQLGVILLTLMLGAPPINEHLAQQFINEQILAGVPRQKAEALIATGGSRGELARVVAIMLRRRDEYRYRTAQDVSHELSRIFNLP